MSIFKKMIHMGLWLLALSAQAQVGTWRAYMSYHEPQEIVKAGGNMLYVRASNSLYSYHLGDHSITTYDKVNALNDTYITHIAWNSQAQRLVIVYQNQNIDLMDLKGNVTNISALYAKTMTQDKTVNSIHVYQQYAYLATGFGVVKVDVAKGEIADSYILNLNVTDVDVIANRIYAKTKDNKVWTASLDDNLIDKGNWNQGTAPEGAFQQKNDWDEYIETVKTLKPDGPKSNCFGYMTYQNNRLYTCSGGNNDGAVQVLQNYDDWTIYQDEGLEAISGLNTYKNVRALAIDPKNPDHVFAGARNGLYEFENGQLVRQYNFTNSPIETFTGKEKDREYQLVYGVLCTDKEVWCMVSQAPTKSMLRMDLGTRQWESVDLPELMRLDDGGLKNKSLATLTGMMTDQRGYVWFVNNHWTIGSAYCFDPNSRKIVKSITQLVNQDGLSYTSDIQPHCITQDLSGNLWIGCKYGPFMLEKDHLYEQSNEVTQVKVPRNDGSNYADYLLSNVDISSIAIDGGNRKWIGTYGNGVYLMDADNITELAHFTAENSPLLSNSVSSIAINHETGEVYFGSDLGLCSYTSDATQAVTEMTKDNIHVYPNPVTPDYNGLITITGLTLDADVKILSPSGALVAQGRSNGGTFTWNGRDRQGRKVASGVYMVATATSGGEKGTVGKIAVIR